MHTGERSALAIAFVECATDLLHRYRGSDFESIFDSHNDYGSQPMDRSTFYPVLVTMVPIHLAQGDRQLG